MREKRKVFRGAFLGMAIGDAMGNAVDRKTLKAICTDYGPNGLLGFDLANGSAEISSYTQMAAFTANGLIMALARNQAYGRSAPARHYVSLALREWARTTHYNSRERNHCWLSDEPQMKCRNCMDIGILDALTRENLGTLQEPVCRNALPTALTEAVPVALMSGFMDLDQEYINRMGAGMIALTHGDTDTFLSGAILTHALCVLLEAPDIGVKALVESVVDAISLEFGPEFGYLGHIWELFQLAQVLAESDTVTPMEAMEQLRCQTAPEVLAGVLYACITCQGDFDTAMITAVNHTGRSAAVGALTGAVLGIIHGEDILPDFYLESLESAEVLYQLADDMAQASIRDRVNRLFDDAWDQKYLRAGV